ncbi:MAG: flotillin family protein [Chlorobi bacterium]|nr:flotillin family protein [Chlorobiota bacterium]MBX7217922.1 flotillin family protein [Candidatus Kapabacteria bacterium]
MEIPVYLVVPAIVVAAVLFLLMAFSSRYKTVSPDEALIVTGAALTGSNVVEDASGRRIKIVRGGGAFILPVFQRYEKLSLLTHKLEVRTPEVVYTSQGVPILADGVAIVKVGSSVEDVATAAEQFLTKPPDALEAEAREVLEGHLRAIMGAMTVEEVYRHRDKFAQEIQGVAALDLKKMGLQIVAFTIKDVRDPHGYLEALGKPRIAAVKREAEIAEAQAYRDARVQKAVADEEAMKAELLRDTRVAEANKEKELQIATFKREQDTAKAEADQAYFIQEARSKQAVTENQMQVELTRKEREIELEEKEIRRRANQYDAEVKKKADAERYAIEQSAEATKLRQMREAEALQYRIEAEARAKAEQQRLEGLAQADAERARGTAEADVIRLKGLAEAEAKQKLAEAFEKFGQAAVLDILVKMMPELAGRIAEPLRSIDKITVVDTGHGEGAARVSNYVTSLMSTAPEMLRSVAGIDVQELIRRFTARAVEGGTKTETEETPS